MRKTRKTISLVLSLLMVIGNIGLLSGLIGNDLFGTKQTAEAAAAGSYYIRVYVHDEMEGTFSTTDSCNNSSGYLVVPTRKQDGTAGTTWSNYVGSGAWDSDNGTWNYYGSNPVNGFPTELRCVQTNSASATDYMKNNNGTFTSKITFKIYVSSDNSNWTEVMSYKESTSAGGKWSDTKSVSSDKYPYVSNAGSVSGATSIVTNGSTTSTYSINNATDQYGVRWGTDSLNWSSSHSAATINSSGVATFGNNNGRDYDVTFSATLGSYTRSITVHVYTSASITYNLNGGTVSGNPTSYNIETAPVRLNNPTRFGYTFTGWTGSNGTTPSTDVSVPNVITGGLSSYTKSNPYTADGRDHVFGNVFTVVPGVTYRVYVTAKRTAGSLNMNGGIWYAAGQTSGNAWDGVGGSFTYLKDAGDGWGVYYKDVTVPAGKQKGQFYVQLEQYSPYGTTWQLADCFVTAPFTSYPLGLDNYTVSNPYTCDGRDHVIGNVFDVTPGKTYRVVVTAKQTAGSLSMNGGIWYAAGQTSGNAWDGVGGAFTYLGDAGNGWGTYYKDVTVPSGKQKGQFYIQMEQYSPYGTVWQIANMAVVDRAQKTALSYTANWSPVNYTISYTLNGGSASGNPTSYTIETSPVKLNNPTRTGYIFNGWTGSNGATPSTDVSTPNVVSSGISYTTASPYTANSRDHKLGNSFTVLPGMVYRVYVTAKRTAGSLNLQGGIWYTSQTTGASYDGYGGEFTYLKDAGNGWGVYYKDVTVPAGKQMGQCYYQINQYDNGTSWQLADCFVTTRFNAVPLGLQQYTTSNPYTCSVRDYVIGNAFDVEVGKTYRVYVTAKRTSGSLTLNGGIAYSAGQTSGAWYDGVGGAFTLESDLGDGWGRYYKDITIPAGKQKGQFYAQIDQWADSATTTWLIADMAIADLSLRNLSYTANWTPITYTVAYNGNGYTGGSTASSSHTYDAAKALTANGFTQTYTVTYNAMGGSVSTTTANTAANSAFAGWATGAGGSAVYSDGQSVTNLSSTNNATVTLYAKWTPGSVTLPTATRNGYTFGGWYTDEACTDANKVTGSSYTPGANKTLYAKWTADPYTVTFAAAGGEAVDPLNYNITDNTTIPATTRSGYRFDGWKVTTASGNWTSGDVVAAGTAVTGKYGSPTLTAQWTPVAYHITYQGDGVTTTVDEYNIESTDSLPLPTREGYEFQGWLASDNTGNWTETTALADGTVLAGRYGDVTLTAQWQADSYAFTMTLEGATTEGAPLSVDYDGAYSFTVTLDEGHNQTTPTVTATNATVAQTRTGDVITVTLSNITGPVTVTVPTVLNTYSLTITGDEGFTSNDTARTVQHGNTLSFTVTLSEGYTNTAPTVTKNGTALTVKTVSGNDYTYEIENVTDDVTVSVTATKNTYAVTFTADSGADAPDGQTIIHGENCSFSVTPRTGYTQAAPTVTMNGETLAAASVVDGTYNYVIAEVKEAKAVVIATTINTYDVTFTSDDGADAPAAQTVTHGQDCSFTVTLNEGYTQTAPVVTVDGETLTGTTDDNLTFAYVIEGVTADKSVAIATAINTYDVTFTSDDGADAPAAQTVDYGATCTFTVTLKTGYTQTAPTVTVDGAALTGTTTDDLTFTYVIENVTADKAVAITTVLNSYAVTFTADDGAEIPATKTVDHNADCEFTVTLKEGYTQTAPTVTVDGEPLEAVDNDGGVYSYKIIGVTADKAVAVTTAINTYDVTFTADDGADAPAAQTITHGQDCEFTVTLNTGYTQNVPSVTVDSAALTGTTEDDLTFTYVIEDVTADKAVAIATTLNSYAVTFTADDGADAPAGQTVAHGADCEFTVTLKTGYTQTDPMVTVDGLPLTALGKEGNVYSYKITDVIADKAVSITTTLNTYDVTFTSDDGADAPAAQTVDHGADCTFTVTLNTGYTQTAPTVTVNGTELDGTTEDDLTFTYVIADVTEAKAVAITTAINKYDVTFTSDDGAAAPAAQTVTHGGDSTFSVTLNTGYTQHAPEVTVNGTAIEGATEDNITFNYVITDVTEDKAVVIGTTLNTYTITWKNYDGEVLDTDTVNHGDKPAYIGDTPEKASTDEFSYAFSGWTPEVATATEATEYTAEFTETTRTYTVTWLNDDGTRLEKDLGVAYGTMAEYNGETPTKERTAQYTYTFKGWDQTVGVVTGDVTYTATYDSTVNSYNVRFFNYNDQLLDSQTLDYGTMPEYAGEAPTKPADKQYTYTFKGWEPEVATVTDAADYVAQYDATINSYTVKFVNGDTVLQEETLDYGTMPEYKGAEPTMEATAEFTYHFTGWDKPIATVTDAETYTAMFDNITNSYEVKFVNYNDEPLQTETLLYGVLPEYKGETPTKPADAQYTYTFDGWDKTVGLVTGEVVYKATYTETVNTYTITWVDEDGTELDSQVLAYGANPVYGGEAPTKAYDDAKHYTFAGWGEVTSVTGAATYTASYTGADHEWDDGRVAVVPTCAALGRKDYVCTVCGAEKDEALDKDPDNHAGGTERRGRIEPTEEEDGYSGDIFCKGCGELLQKGNTLRNLKGYCQYCGGYHEGLLGAIITAVHGIIWLFHKAFSLGNPYET